MDRLVENLVHFGRVLRTAGLPIGTDRLMLAAQALQAGGLASRADFKATLAACLVDRPEHRPLFEQAFHVFWRDPDLLGRIMALLLPQAQGRAATPPPPENRRWPTRCSRRRRRRPRRASSRSTSRPASTPATASCCSAATSTR